MVVEVAVAKSARTAAKRIFNRNVKKITDSIEAEDAPTLIETRFQDLKWLWNDLQDKHEKYIEALQDSKVSYDANAEDEWIDEMDGIYESVLRRKLAYMKVIEDAQKEKEKQQKENSEEQETQLRRQEANRVIARAAQSRKIEETAFNQEVEKPSSFDAGNDEKRAKETAWTM